ncbi:MAG: hypothetical protein QXO51_06010 [Halobacteria archaeon]
MDEEFGQHLPLEGAIRFFQAVERFGKYCSLCKSFKEPEARLGCSGQVRESLDTAYAEFLMAFPLVLPLSEGTRPMPATGDVTTEELKALFQKQLRALDGGRVKEVIGWIEKLRASVPGDGCLLETSKAESEALQAFAGRVKKGAEAFFVEDVLSTIRRQLEAAAKDPDSFRAMLPLPPKPLKDEYRL